MKQLFSLSLLTVCTAFLFSCETQDTRPSRQVHTMSDNNAVGCTDNSYWNKVSGTVNFGIPNGEMVLVGFEEGMTLAAKEKLLNRYPQFHSIAGEIAMDSGIITKVRLHQGSTCFDAEKLMGKLVKETSVAFVYPMFTQDENDPASPQIGLTNEFMVSIEGTGTLAQLEKLVKDTNTSFVFSFSDEVHVLSADKNSTAGILELLTLFNQQDFVAVAEPNLTFVFPSQNSQNEASGTGITSKFLQQGAFKAFGKKD